MGRQPFYNNIRITRTGFTNHAAAADGEIFTFCTTNWEGGTPSSKSRPGCREIPRDKPENYQGGREMKYLLFILAYLLVVVLYGLYVSKKKVKKVRTLQQAARVFPLSLF